MGSISSNVDPTARALAAVGIADAAAAQNTASVALGLVPFASAVFSVSAGVLTVHSSYGIDSITRSGIGTYDIVLSSAPPNYSVNHNCVPSVSAAANSNYFTKDLSRLVHLENGVSQDVSNAAQPSSISFNEV